MGSERAPPLDSFEGISILIRWARTSKAILTLNHKGLAERYGVPTDGVIFAGPGPSRKATRAALAHGDTNADT